MNTNKIVLRVGTTETDHDHTISAFGDSKEVPKLGAVDQIKKAKGGFSWRSHPTNHLTQTLIVGCIFTVVIIIFSVLYFSPDISNLATRLRKSSSKSLLSDPSETLITLRNHRDRGDFVYAAFLRGHCLNLSTDNRSSVEDSEKCRSELMFRLQTQDITRIEGVIWRGEKMDSTRRIALAIVLGRNTSIWFVPCPNNARSEADRHFLHDQAVHVDMETSLLSFYCPESSWGKAISKLSKKYSVQIGKKQYFRGCALHLPYGFLPNQDPLHESILDLTCDFVSQ